MRFTAGVAMIDPSFYLPFARAAEDAGFDAIAVPDSIAYPNESSIDLPVQRRRHARVPREQALPRTDGRDRGDGRDHRARGVLHVRAQDADAPPRSVGQGDHVGRGADGQPPQVRGGIEPVAGRLRHRRPSVEGSWPAVRRVHRDRARAVDRRVLRVPRRVLRHPVDQAQPCSDRADPDLDRWPCRRQPAAGSANRRRMDGGRRVTRRGDGHDRTHPRRCAASTGGTTSRSRSSRPPSTPSVPTGSSGSRTSG